MILSNVGIQAALDSGALVIDPEPAPRRPEPGVDCPYQTSAVDLRLGDEIAWLRKGLPIAFDLRGGGLARLFTEENTERRSLRESEPYVLHPGHFVLGKTLERIELPITENGPWLAARVEGRSSYARCGLLVHFTAPTIHTGFRGCITLEMMNFGPYPIHLSHGTPICQLIIEHLDARPFANESQFQDQTSPEGR